MKDDEKKTIIIELPYPVSGNRYWRKVGGRVVLSAAAKKYRSIVKSIAMCNGITGANGMGARRVKVTRVFYQPDKRVRDMGNHTKVLDDALTLAGVWNDDGQIDDERNLRGIGPSRVIVRIEEADNKGLDLDKLIYG